MSHEQEITVQAPSASDSRGTVVASLVPEVRRMEFLPSKFGVTAMLKVETAVFAWMQRLCPAHEHLSIAPVDIDPVAAASESARTCWTFLFEVDRAALAEKYFISPFEMYELLIASVIRRT